MSTQDDWNPSPEMLAPTDAAEFKFCFALFHAAAAGKMPTPSPERSFMLLQDEETGDVSETRLTDRPMTRGILAVSEHFKLAHPRPADAPTPPEWFALAQRIYALSGLIDDSLHGGCKLAEKFILIGDGKNIQVNEALIEAGASAPMSKSGRLNAKKLCAIANRLLEEEEEEPNANEQG